MVTEGQGPRLFLDLLSVPYYAAAIERMIRTARTQAATPYYVADRNATATDPDGGVTDGMLRSVSDGETIASATCWARAQHPRRDDRAH